MSSASFGDNGKGSRCIPEGPTYHIAVPKYINWIEETIDSLEREENF
jgi:hypothetical protein